jgi:NAD(P)-dependent dehydrogenase (short-subunit alcohol dehydrogenase family)
MMERRAGCIIVISAIASYRTDPSMSAYCVGKTAQNRLIQFVASEAGDRGIAAFAVDPGFVITEMAEITMRDPGAQRWVPHMIERLKAHKAESNSRQDLDRCAQRCVELASGRYNALSGRYFEATDNLDDLMQDKDPFAKWVAVPLPPIHWR